MVKIRLFCVAGILSGVIVNKMRDAAKLRELEVDIQSFSESHMRKRLEEADVVLLGPQIAYKLPKVKLLCEPFGIASNLIPMKDLGMMNGNNILDIALKSIEEEKEKVAREAIEKEIPEREAAEKAEQEAIEKQIAEKAEKEAIERQIAEREAAEKAEQKVNQIEDEASYGKISKIESKDYKIDNILNMKGYDNMIKKVKELILSAEKEIYISSNIDITVFKEEIIEISQRGVRLTVVSFKEYDSEELPIDTLYTYVDEKNKNKDSIIMIVVDDNKALVANNNIGEEQVSDVVTDNKLLVSVISKNIINNIYLLKLRDNIAYKLKDI